MDPAVAEPAEEGYWAPAAQASTPAATEPVKPIAETPEHEEYWSAASRATPAPSDESYWQSPAQAAPPAEPAAPVVAPAGNTIQAAPPPTQLEQLRNTIANSAIGTALENAAPKVADLLHLHPTETVNSPTYQQDQQQLIAPQYAAEGAGKQGPNGEPSKFSDVARGVGEAAGGLTSAPMLAAAAVPVAELAGLFGATGARLIPRLVSAGFSASMLKGLYDKVGPFRDAIHRGDYATARQLAGQAIVEAPLAAATALHAATGDHAADNVPASKPTPEAQSLAKEPVTGREVLQPNATPAKLNKAAKQEAPALEDGLKRAVDPIPGARVDAVRPSKNPERIRQKIEEEGQPASTIPDYLASRVVVDSPAARTAAVSAIKAQFPTVRDVDQFNDGDEDFGYRVHKLQVNTPSGLTAEVHIVPKEVADINADEHMNYKKARQADITGSDKQFAAAAKKAKDANDAAMEAFNKRNALEPTSQAPTPEPEGGRGESPEPEKPAVSQPATPATPKAGSYALLPDGSVGKIDYYNEGMNRGRMTTVDGRKLPTVRGADMTPLAEVKPGKEATGEPLEKELAERNKTEGPKLLAQYLKDNVYHGIPSVSTDAAKSLYPEYVADPTKTNSDVNQAAAAIADAAWRTLISRPPVEGKEIVSVLTGAPASGKTTMVRDGGAGNSIGINREAILQDLPYASKLVDDVINSGRVPEISLAYTRDPAENLRRAVARATESGRPVPIDYMAKAYVTVPKIISALAEKYGDKIKVDAWDTTENKPVTHKGTVQPAVEATGKYTEQTAREAMLDELRHLRTQGKVSEKLYEAFTGPSLAETAAGHPGQVDSEAGSGARGERKDADRGADAGRGSEEGLRLNGESGDSERRSGDSNGGGVSSRRPVQPEDSVDGNRREVRSERRGDGERAGDQHGGDAEPRNEGGKDGRPAGEKVNGNVSDERTKESVSTPEQSATSKPSDQGEGSLGVGSRSDDGSGDRLLLRESGSGGQGEGAAGQVAEGKKGGVDGHVEVRTSDRRGTAQGGGDDGAAKLPSTDRGDSDRGSKATVSDEGRSAGAGDRNGNKEGRTEPAGLQPGEVGRVPLSELHVDPKRFQYKLNTDESGATNKLKDVPWDDELSGSIWAWRDPEDGKLYVVNGHHRFDLARHGGAKDMAVRVFGTEVKTAAEARVKGALQNIAEGNGTTVDAAKFMRDTGFTDLKKYGVSPDGPIAGGGMALARLDQKFFDDVVAGRIPEKRGIAIGRAAETPEQQEALVKLLAQAEKRGKHITNATIDELGRLVKSSGESTSTQDSLFGSFETTKNLALEKAEVSEFIRRALGTEKNLFGGLTNAKKAAVLEAGDNKINAKGNKDIAEKAAHAQELYDKLSTKAGPLNDILDAASKQLGDGEDATTVKARAYKDARAALAEVIRGTAGEAREESQKGPATPEAREAGKPAGDLPLKPTAKEVAETLRAKGKKVKTADEIKPGVAFKQGDEAGPTWYLKSERLIDQKMKGPMSGPDVLRMLENGGVKRDELKWTGLEDALKGKFRVKPEEVKQAIAEGGIQIKEVTRGAKYSPGTRQRMSDIREELDEMGEPTEDTQDRWDALGKELDDLTKPERQSGPTKYGDYQLPGGENYREMLLTLPHIDPPSKAAAALFDMRNKLDAKYGIPVFFGDASLEKLTPDEREEYKRVEAAADATEFASKSVERFKSGHWDEPNILAHIRFNDRVTPEGKKLLHIEEIQSDWHQKGRDKGYRTDVKKATYHVEDDGKGNFSVVNQAGESVITAGTREYAQTRADEYNADGLPSHLAGRDGYGEVPDAPFKKDWHEMAFRRAVRYAAENDYDGVSWTPGEKQAERYDLSKQVKALHYYPEARELTAIPVKQSDAINYTDVAPEKLADYVGKEGARKLLEQPIDETGAHRLEGVDLKLGGEGMKGFYDKIIPDYARKFGKQWGARVGEEKIPVTAAMEYDDDVPRDATQTVPTLDITPAMRKSVVEEGVPMFKDRTPAQAMQDASRFARHSEADVIEPWGKEHPAPMLRANAFARKLLNSVDPSLNVGGNWHGVTLPEGYADQTIQALEATAEHLRSNGESAQASRIEQLATAIHESRDSEGNVIIVGSGQEGFDAINEEQFHAFQMRKGAGLGDITMRMGDMPEIAKAQKYLKRKGYPDDANIAMLEATAKSASDDWTGAGLTEEEGARVLDAFFDALVQSKGKEVLNDAPVITDLMERTLEKARLKHGAETEVHDKIGSSDDVGQGSSGKEGKAHPTAADLRERLSGRKDQGGAPAEHPGRNAGEQGRLFKAVQPVEETDEDALDRLTSKTKALDTKKQTLAEKLGKSANKSVTAVTENVSKAAELKDDILRNGKAMLQNLVKPREWTDYDALTGEFQAQEQKADLAMAEYAKEIKRVVPDKIRREAITNWIQANGDKDLLKERARTSQSKYRDGYKLAAELTPDEVAIAKGMRQYMNEQFDAGLKAGLDVHFANLYMSQIYEGDAKGLKSLINFGELAPNPAFIKKRVFQNYFEAEMAGEKPKDKDAAFLLTAYHDSVTKAVSSRAYIRSLLEGKAEDGRPLAILDTNGAYVQISPDQERYVITPKPRPDDMAKYRHVDHPALRNWKWDLSEKEAEEVNPKLFEDSTKALVKSGDLMLHPEIATRVQNILSKSAIQENAIGRAALAVSSSLKHTLLSFSGFHQTQETIHALGHKVNPLNMVKLDLRDPKQYDLASHGLLVADFSGQQAFSEGVSGGALVNYIPVIGDAMAAYQHYLFRDYIPRLKMTMALHALERNTVRYAGKLDRDQILRLTADQSNAAFGGQNQKMGGDLATNKTFQDITRLLLLAPDFLWSRMKFAGQALLPHGMEQRAALVRSALVMYAGARILNYILNDGDAKFDRKDAFTIVYKGKGYGVRSVPEDILHLIEDPRSFTYNRINPMTLKPAIEFITGRDAFGRQKSTGSQMEDFVKGIAPIPAQGYINNAETSPIQSILGAMGIQVTQYRTTAELNAHKARMRMIPDTPEGKDEEAESRLKLKMEKDLRAGKITPTDLWNKVKEGKLTPHEAGRAMKDAQLTPLQKDFKALTIKDAMDVYAKATPAERETLKPELEAKRARTQKEKPRVMAMLNGKLDKLLAQ